MTRNCWTRRSVLKRGAVAAGVLGTATGTATAATTISGGGGALQAAIDAAAPGDTLTVVDSATYDPVVVDVDVTIETTGAPTVDGDGTGVDDGTGSAISVAADGVTVDGLTVTNPDGLLGIKVERGHDEVTLVNNTIDDVGPTGRLGVTGIVVGQGDHDGIDVRNNTIQNLDQETTDDSGFPTVNGILFDADNSDPGTVTDTTVDNNVIRDVESDIAPLGIVTQHRLDGVSVNNNDIRELTAADSTDSDPNDGVDFGFTFAQGINVASPATTDTDIAHNRITDVTSAETILPEAIKVDGDGGGLTVRVNELLVAIGLNNRNGTKGATDAPTVDAKNNWWDSPQGPETASFNQAADADGRADVVGNVRAEPFLRQPPSGQGSP